MPDALGSLPGSLPQPNSAQRSKTSSSQDALGVKFGKSLGSVPSNLLGPGITGSGWTISHEGLNGDERFVHLVRRIGQTDGVEEIDIDAETYNKIQTYKKRNGEMARSAPHMVLRREELGHALDPRLDITPDFFDASSKSYRARLSGNRLTWIGEDLIRDLKQGKSGAYEKLRTIQNAGQPQEASFGDKISTGVLEAVAGKTILQALGLGRPQKPLPPIIPEKSDPKEQKKEEGANTENRAQQEIDARNRRLRNEKDESEDQQEENQDQKKADASTPAAYRTTTFTEIQEPGKAPRMQANGPQASTSVRLTTGQAPRSEKPGRLGTSVQLAEPLSNDIQTPTSPTASNQPLNPVRSAAPRSRPRSSEVQDTEAPSAPILPNTGYAEGEETSRASPYTLPASRVGGVSVGGNAQAQSDIDTLRADLRSARPKISSRSKTSSSPAPSFQFSPSQPRSTDAKAQPSQVAFGLAPLAIAFGAAVAEAATTIQGLSRQEAFAHIESLMKRGQNLTFNQQAGPSQETPAQASTTQEPPHAKKTDETTFSTQPTSTQNPSKETNPTSLEELGELVELEQKLSHLRKLQAALLVLPSQEPVPVNFAQSFSTPSQASASNVSSVSAVPSAVPSPVPIPSASHTAISEPAPSNELVEQQAIAVPTPPLTPTTIQPAQESPTDPAPKRSSSVPVGAPALPTRTPKKPTSTLFGGIKSRLLPAAFMAMTNLHAAQNAERGASFNQDPRETALGEDSSSTGNQGASSRTSPLAVTNPIKTLQEEEGNDDTLQTSGEQAQEMREQGDRMQATGDQFSNTNGEDPHTPPSTSAQVPSSQPQAPLSPQAQIRAAEGLQMARLKDRSQKEEQPKKEPIKNAKKMPTTPGSFFRQQLTAWKLLWDIVEGCADVFGFLEFVVESNLALINDKYFHASFLPTLTIPGGSDRANRYVQYAVILMNCLLLAVLALAICLIIVAIVLVIYVAQHPGEFIAHRISEAIAH